MRKLLFSFAAAAFVLMISGCNKEIGNTDGKGRLVIKVTDAPFPFDMVESATVTITKVEIRRVGDGIPDGNPFMTVCEDTVVFDLLELRNGVVEELVDLEVPEGSYDLVRLYVEDAGLKVRDGGDFKVKVPSGQQTGIKIFINPYLEVEGGLTSELLLDFDLSKSFVVQGNPFTPAGIKGFIFTPVIRAVNNTMAGRITGHVVDTAKAVVKEASVWAEQDTVVVTGITDTTGYYAFIGLPEGTYSVYATKEDFDTVGVEDVRVVKGNRTIVNFMLTEQEK
jgi:hypothetical protein